MSTGYPLPRVKIAPNRHQDPLSPERWFPVPWVNGAHGLRGDFYSFRDDVSRAHTERLCCICGDRMTGPISTLAALSGRRETSGGWGHPKCVLLAVRVCPHFADLLDGTVAWVVEGPGVGVVDESPGYEIDPVSDAAIALTLSDLQALAQRDPMGTTQPTAPVSDVAASEEGSA